MPGFAPNGYVDIARVREIWGVQRLGGYLAEGRVIAHVQIDGQPWEDVPKAAWLDDRAQEWVEIGALVTEDGEVLPLKVSSAIHTHPLTVLLQAYENDLAARAAGPIPKPPTPARNVGGRPNKWDWEGAMIELSRLDAEGGTVNKTAPQLARHMRDWFIGHTGDAPADSEIRRRVKRYRDALT